VIEKKYSLGYSASGVSRDAIKRKCWVLMKRLHPASEELLRRNKRLTVVGNQVPPALLWRRECTSALLGREEACELEQE
jgi:hypothetical protein